MLKEIAITSQMFRHGGIANRDWFSDKLFKALNISIKTSTDRAIVIGFGLVKMEQGTPVKAARSTWH